MFFECLRVSFFDLFVDLVLTTLMRAQPDDKGIFSKHKEHAELLRWLPSSVVINNQRVVYFKSNRFFCASSVLLFRTSPVV